MKDKPPKAALVKLRVDLLKVLKIDEVAMMYKTQYTVNLEWLDPRIIFHNLHKDQGLNTLVEEEKYKIWTPELIFDNTKQKTRTKTDKESAVSVKREGNYTQNTMDDVDNIYKFEGFEDDGIEVMKNNWVGNTGQLGLDLISRHEDVQVYILFVISHPLQLHYRLLH